MNQLPGLKLKVLRNSEKIAEQVNQTDHLCTVEGCAPVEVRPVFTSELALICG